MNIDYCYVALAIVTAVAIAATLGFIVVYRMFLEDVK